VRLKGRFNIHTVYEFKMAVRSETSPLLMTSTQARALVEMRKVRRFSGVRIDGSSRGSAGIVVLVIVLVLSPFPSPIFDLTDYFPSSSVGDAARKVLRLSCRVQARISRDGWGRQEDTLR
jgi:hypothetical protein